MEPSEQHRIRISPMETILWACAIGIYTFGAIYDKELPTPCELVRDTARDVAYYAKEIRDYLLTHR